MGRKDRILGVLDEKELLELVGSSSIDLSRGAPKRQVLIRAAKARYSLQELERKFSSRGDLEVAISYWEDLYCP